VGPQAAVALAAARGLEAQDSARALYTRTLALLTTAQAGMSETLNCGGDLTAWSNARSL
jgi:hypothetical protein